MRKRRALLDEAFYEPPYFRFCAEAEIVDGVLKWNPSGSTVNTSLKVADLDNRQWLCEAPLERFDRLCIGYEIASFELLMVPPRARRFGFDFSVPSYSVVLDVSGMHKNELASFTKSMRRLMSKDARVLCA